MVLETLQNELALVITICAILSSFSGIILVNTLFKDKIKELFTDQNFFVFAILIFGYSLFALGEVSMYLFLRLFKEPTTASMPDFYWVTGAMFILIAFVTLTIILFKEHGSGNKLVFLAVSGAIIVGLTVMIKGGLSVEGGFLAYYYPIMSALILTFSLPVLLFREKLQKFFGRPLALLVFANFAILVADILFTYRTELGTYGLLGGIADLFYVAGYGLSAITFLTIIKQVYSEKIS